MTGNRIYCVCSMMLCIVAVSRQQSGNNPSNNTPDPGSTPNYVATRTGNKPLIEPMSFPMEQSAGSHPLLDAPQNVQASIPFSMDPPYSVGGRPNDQSFRTAENLRSEGPKGMQQSTSFNTQRRRYIIVNPRRLQPSQPVRKNQRTTTEFSSGRSTGPTRFASTRQRENPRGGQDRRQYQTMRQSEQNQFLNQPTGNQIVNDINKPFLNMPIRPSSFPLPPDPQPFKFGQPIGKGQNHPEFTTKYYMIEVTFENPTSALDNTFEILQSIYTIFRSMSINNLIPEDAFKIVAKPRVILIVKGVQGSVDITSSIERVVRSLERLGTKTETKLLYSLEAFVESAAIRYMPLSNLVQSTRFPVPELGNTDIYLCTVTITGTGMDKSTYIRQTLNQTLEMLEKRAEGLVKFKGHRLAGTLPFQFQFYGNHGPNGNEITAFDSIPILNAANVVITTDEVQSLNHVLLTMKNTEAVTIARI